MRVMNLPDLQIVDSLEFANGLHKSRIKRARSDSSGGLHAPLKASAYLVGYMAWPSNDEKRNRWMAAVISRYLTDHRQGSEPPPMFPSFGGLKAISDPAFEAVSEDLSAIEMRWQAVADVFGRFIDMVADGGLQLRGGPSISKAKELCELDRTYKRAQLERFWSEFRDVAHLVTAGAVLAHAQPDSSARSIFLAAWLSPDAVIGIADWYENVGLRFKPHGVGDTVLPSETTWRIPEFYCKNEPFVVSRQLSPEQRAFLEQRKSRKTYISKPD
jgi:hypothetical protein